MKCSTIYVKNKGKQVEQKPIFIIFHHFSSFSVEIRDSTPRVGAANARLGPNPPAAPRARPVARHSRELQGLEVYSKPQTHKNPSKALFFISFSFLCSSHFGFPVAPKGSLALKNRFEEGLCLTELSQVPQAAAQVTG